MHTYSSPFRYKTRWEVDVNDDDYSIGDLEVEDLDIHTQEEQQPELSNGVDHLASVAQEILDTASSSNINHHNGLGDYDSEPLVLVVGPDGDYFTKQFSSQEGNSILRRVPVSPKWNVWEDDFPFSVPKYTTDPGDQTTVWLCFIAILLIVFFVILAVGLIFQLVRRAIQRRKENKLMEEYFRCQIKPRKVSLVRSISSSHVVPDKAKCLLGHCESGGLPRHYGDERCI